MTAPAEDSRGGEDGQACADCGRDDGHHDEPAHVRVWARRGPTPPAAGGGDTDSGGEDRWAGTPWAEAAKLAREVLLAEPASWVVYRIGAALAARPAGGRAQPTEGLREAIVERRALAASQIECDIAEVLHQHVVWADALDFAAQLLTGPLAALLDAQDKVERVEALCDAKDGIANGARWLHAGTIRRALDGG